MHCMKDPAMAGMDGREVGPPVSGALYSILHARQPIHHTTTAALTVPPHFLRRGPGGRIEHLHEHQVARRDSCGRIRRGRCLSTDPYPAP